MSKYLIIPRIEVHGANAQSAYWLVSGPSPLAHMGLVRKLALDMGVEDSHAINVAVVHHHIDMLGEWFYGDFNPSQLRGQALTVKSRGMSDDNVGNTISMSLQPVALCNLTVTLIIENFDEKDDDRLLSQLMKSRLAGGQIVNCQPFKRVDWDGILNALGGGFFMKERSDLLAGCASEDRLQVFVKQLFDAGLAEKADEKPWLVPLNLGFLPISESIACENIHAMPHLYCEPLVGLVEYISKNAIDDNQLQELFWSYRKADNAFVVSQC